MTEPVYHTAAQEGQEKHVPVIETIPGGVKVKVGSVPHPMTPEHHIGWIEIVTASGEITREELTPDEEPEATFVTDEEVVEARCFCNLHGLWTSKE